LTDPKKDYRYTLGDLQVEGYQITPNSRYVSQDWPAWLKTQRLPDEPNCLFAMSEDPTRMWLSLPTGDVELPALAWVVKYADGHLGIVDALDFDNYVKVVPIPAKIHEPPADGMPDESHLAAIYPQHVKDGMTVEDYKRPAAEVTPLKPVASAENVGGDVTEMRNEMMSAIRLLQEGNEQGETGLPPKGEEALDYLIHAMARRTRWCNCPPGQCSGADEAGCRLNSPLVKNG